MEARVSSNHPKVSRSFCIIDPAETDHPDGDHRGLDCHWPRLLGLVLQELHPSYHPPCIDIAHPVPGIHYVLRPRTHEKLHPLVVEGPRHPVVSEERHVQLVRHHRVGGYPIAASKGRAEGTKVVQGCFEDPEALAVPGRKQSHHPVRDPFRLVATGRETRIGSRGKKPRCLVLLRRLWIVLSLRILDGISITAVVVVGSGSGNSERIVE
mmetsp:Transcript_3837/g.10914  ORF Transcript_3837/g.10914 Transcript_3837/m.10914 type:complete len:210 (+) Transcript_3837:5063-5692(+)